MNNELVEDIISESKQFLNNEQIIKLKQIIINKCELYKIEKIDKTQNEVMQQNNKEILNKFLSAKEIEGCSTQTIALYRKTINKVLNNIQLPINEITTEILRNYLYDYKNRSTANMGTIDNIRRIMSSYFNWLENEDYIVKSPVRRIHKIKTLRYDITKEALLKYLEIRDNSHDKERTNPLFLTDYGFRMSVTTIKKIVKRAYRKTNLDENVYSVHTLRHTCATILYKAGCNIRTIQEILGHVQIDTTEIYTHLYNKQVMDAMLEHPMSSFMMADAVGY